MKPTDAASASDSRGDAPAETASPEDATTDAGAPEDAVGENSDGSDSLDAIAIAEGGEAGAGAPDASSIADGASDVAVEASPPPASGSPLRTLAIAAGLTETCALLDNHRIKCWGVNVFGSLGTGDTCARGAPAQMGDALPFVDLGTGRTATALSSGRYHSCAILDDGSVKCWGFRSLTGLPFPPAAANQVGIGDEPGEMGDALPALDFGPGRKATQIACGYDDSCAVLDDGSAWCWGETNVVPTATPLGSTSKVRQLAAAKSGVVAVFEDGTVSSVLPGNTPSIVVGADEKATSIAGGGLAMSLCAIVDGGRVECTPPSGAGIETTNVALTALGLGLEFSCGLSQLGDVRCWGLGNGSYWSAGARLPDGSSAVALGQKAVALVSGNDDHTCALLSDGSVRCWGADDLCTTFAGTSACPVPTTENFNLGGSVDTVGTGATCQVRAWHAVNLGTHP